MSGTLLRVTALVAVIVDRRLDMGKSGSSTVYTIRSWWSNRNMKRGSLMVARARAI